MRAILWCAVSSTAQNEPDKISLPTQEAETRAVALKNNWSVTDLMLVPGHSRRYIDFHQLMVDAGKQGIDAFVKLQKHWETRDFDVLIVLDGNRFARTQALHAYVVERTIDSGAFIYSLRDGVIDKHNYRMWISMNGYKSAGEIDHLVKSRDEAMTARAARGLPISSRVPMSHTLIRDPKSGKALCLEVNEDRRSLWNNLATLILQGISWDRMEEELFVRYGHVQENGKKFYANYMYRLVMKPIFWGHIARYHNNLKSKNGFRYGLWIFDESEPTPPEVVIFRNTHQAVWTGELGELIKAELRRRTEMGIGRCTAEKTHRFSGLAVCAECGSFVRTHVSKGIYRGLNCPAATTHLYKYVNVKRCGSNKTLNERFMIQRMNQYLEQMLELHTTEVFSSSVDPRPAIEERLKLLQGEISELESQVRLLISKQLTAGESLQQFYDEKLSELNERLKNMKSTEASLKAQSTAEREETVMQQQTLDELAQLSLQQFWQQDSRYINQVLHRLMGKKRLLLLNGDIVGVAEVNKRQRRHT